MKITITGIYKRTIFQSEKGYIIGLLKLKDTDNEELEMYVNKTITFTGYFHELIIDEAYSFTGEIVNHPKYGLQFQVTNYEKLKPIDKVGIIEFLSSDLFPGVGKTLATSIIETLGTDALNKIIDTPEVLMNVPKLSNKKATVIIENLKKYEESNKIYIHLTEIGFNIKEAMCIYNRYKKMTLDIINNNIYQIINSEDEISFLKVDQVALREGIDVQDKNRIKACIIYIMENLVYSNGDTYLEYIDIIKNVENYLKLELNGNYFIDYLYELEKENKIIKYNEHYYLSDLFKAENYVCDKIINLSSLDSKKIKNIDNTIKELEKVNSISYNDKQRLAIKKAIENNILIITGGPGTGKTTIIKAIVELYSKLNDLSYDELIERVALLAPTGRASKRMSESTNLPASTIHRFLKWDKETNKFAINEFNPNMQELIIVDEVSMIDINLLNSLFKGLTNNIKVVLVGDYN
ncbi:MAG TPA: AAA family ATPase, partial [Bacilli bacterium]|nr:AAA family ATPase [Bacilli bacterium]